MSELLLIDGVIPAGAGTVARAEVCQRPATARIAPGLHLPLAGAVFLHLALLTLALTASRLGGKPEQVAEVYPIRLYSVAEVAASVPGEPPDLVSSPVRRSSSVVPAVQSPTPVEEMAPAVARPGGGERVVSTAAPAPAVQTVALAQAPSGGNVGLSTSGNRPAFLAEAAESFEVATPMASGEGRSVTAAPPDSLEVLAHPLYRENPEPEYPPLARRRQQEGTVVLEALVNPDGKVGGLAVRQSSGHPLLDEAALKGVKGWRFEPGRRGAVAVVMKVLVPVRFGLR